MGVLEKFYNTDFEKHDYNVFSKDIPARSSNVSTSAWFKCHKMYIKPEFGIDWPDGGIGSFI